MSFQISPELDANKVFLINYSELGDRFDPIFCIAIENIQKNVAEKAKYQCVDMKNICSITRGRFGHRPRNDPKYYIGNYPFIQTGDVVKASSENSSIEYTQTLNELGLSTSRLFDPPKLLFTIAANIGDTAILDYQSCFPDSIVALNPKNDRLLIGYLNIYLRIIKKYVVELAPYSAQRNLNNQQLSKIPVVVPPVEIQSAIIAKMDAAYSSKREKEAEAQRLLDSIDAYLLGELGIDLPEQEENTVQSRIFIRRFSEISGGRLDPIYFFANLDSFYSGKYESFKLSSIVSEFSSGVGAGKQDQVSEADGLIQIRPTNIDQHGNIKYDKNVYLPHDFQGSKIKKDDVLFNNTNSQVLVGKTAILKEERDLFFSNHITKITVDRKKAVPDYLMLILNSYQKHRIFFAICTNWNNQSGIGLDLLKSLKFPVPPLQRQAEIADHITLIRSRAKQLQQEAKEGLEQAKRAVEAMILGDA